MRGWSGLLGGFIVWAVHFFALYIIGSVFLTTSLARVLVGIVTLACLAAITVLLVRILRTTTPSPMEGWMRVVALGGVGLSVVAIVWQALPAVIL